MTDLSPQQFLAAVDMIAAQQEPANSIDAGLQELQFSECQNLEPGNRAGLFSYGKETSK